MAGNTGGTTPEATHSGDDVPEGARTLKVGATEIQLADLQAGDEIVLPDGTVIDAEILLEAVKSGADYIVLEDGTKIDLEALLVALGLETGVPTIKDGEDDQAQNEQASFSRGPLIEIIQGLIEKGAIDPTQLIYRLPEHDDTLTGYDEDEKDNLPDLVWAIVGDTTVEEGNDAIYTVSYTGTTLHSGQTVTISVGNGGGFDSNLSDAVSGSDYDSLSTTLTFTGGGATSHTVAVSTIDDTTVEGDEDFTVTIADPTGGSIVTSQANTIIDDNGDETLVQWSVAGPSAVTEGATATYTVSYTGATLAPGQTATITVGSTDLAGGDPNATSGTDYTSLGTILTFTGGGATSRTVAVSTIQDTILEGTEDYAVTIGNPSMGSVTTSQADTDIIDNDASNVTWSVAGPSVVLEGQTAAYTVSYTGATLAPGQTATITVGSSDLAGGFPNADAGVDYTSLTQVLTFTAGSTSQTVAVSTIDDTVLEGTEDFRVTIGGQSVGGIATSQADTGILNSDREGEVRLNWSITGSSEVSEGATGLYTVSYTGVTLAPGQTITVSVGTANLTTGDPNATAGSDYTALSQVLTFTAGTGTTQTVAVSTIQDTVLEGTEDYAVTISGPNVGNLLVSQADTDIIDNDASNLNWSIAGPSAVTEGNTGLYTVSYNGATLAPGVTATITVGSTDLAGGDPNATSDTDYTALSTILTFTSGSTSQTVAVSTIQDTIVEGTEDYAVTIGGQSVGNVSTSQADTDILDNDASNLNWSVAGPSAVTEGNSSVYTVSYTGATLAPGQTATITVGSTDLAGGDPNATSNTDYTSLNTILTFTAGSTSQTVAVSTIYDTIVEGTEDYAVTIGGQSVGNVSTSQADTDILDDDASNLNWSVAGPSAVIEGNSGIYTVSYNGATLAPGVTATITVGSTDLAGGDPNATSGTDYTALNTILTFTAGSTSQTVAVSTIQDTIVEGTEDYAVTIGGQSVGNVTTSQADTDILDNDASDLNWSVAGPSAVTEGNSSVYTVSYTGATLAPGVTATITVGSTDLAGGDPNATSDTDYTSLSTILTFTAGSTSQTVAVSTIQDTIVEGTEDYAVTIGGQSVGNVSTSQADTDILDNDASNLNWSVAGPDSVSEGNTGTYTVSYTGATLAPGVTATITVGSTDLAGGDPNATSNTDYTSLNTVLTFTAGNTSQTVAVSTIYDTIVEGTEDYAVTIGGQSVGNVATSQADTDILDDDASNLNWSVAGPSAVIEGNSGIYTVSYNGATLAPGVTATITVGSTDLAGGDPNAISGTDYTALGTVLTFTAGSTSQTVAVSTIQDTIVEGTEDYAVTIGGQSVGNVTTSQADTDILDNDASDLNWSVAGPSAVTEGNSSVYTVSYTGATLAPGVTATITVGSTDLAGGDPDATSDTDYTSLSTILTFTSGSTSQTVAVSTIQDTIVEGTEDYAVTIGGQSVGNVTTSQADTDILDNDASNLNWSVAGSSEVTEGGSASYTVSYTGATLAPGQTATITVGSTDLAGGDPNAASGTDYTVLSTILTFTAGTGTSQTVAVSTVEDTILEGTEDYAVTIGGQSIGNVTTSQADTDIVDVISDTLPAWSITGSSEVNEGETGIYTVSYTGASLAPGITATITVGSTDLAGGNTDATSDTDYTSLGTILTFTAGTTSQTVAVSTIQDTTLEGTEDFAVTIGGQSVGGVLTSQAGTDIVDDDASNLSWSLTGSSEVTEGGTASYTVSYTGVTLAPGQTATITVGSTNLAGGDTDATSDTDYTSLGTILTFTAGSGTSQTVAVSTIEDTVLEGTEDFAVTIGGQSVGNVTTSQADTDITDNDASNLNWSIAGSSEITEGGNGVYTVSYTGVTLAPGQTATITVGSTDLAGGDPNATSDTDYTSLSTILTFTAGTGTSQTVAVSTIEDTILEGTEDFAVTIDGQSVGNVTTSQVDTDILDNDASNLNWSIAGSSEVTEGGTGVYTVSYTGVTLAPGQTATITVGSTDLAGGDPNAASGTDYTALGTILTFTAGSGTSQTVEVSTIEDTVLEGTEDFAVTIDGQSVGNVSTSQADTDIVDNDASNLNWSIAGSSEVTEGGTAAYTVSYTGVTLAPGQTATITVGSTDLAGGDTDATSDTDYTSLNTVLTFTSGTGTSQTVAVSTIQDTIVEGTEDYAVTIGGQSIGNVTTSQADTDIVDNDASNLNWSIVGSSEVTEGDSGAYTVSYTGATLAPGQTATITVGSTDLAGGDTDATSGTDYTSLGTVLTFTSGSTSQTVAVSTIQDTIVEGTEDFAVTIGGQSSGSVTTSQADSDIVDDDASNLVWTLTGPNLVTEGNTANYTVSYTGVTLAPGQTATIQVASTNLGGGYPDATPDTDFTSLNTVLTFTAGSGTSQTVAVSTIEDTIVEGTEDYDVTLGGQNMGTVSTGTVGTDIVDDDPTNLNWSITGSSEVTEGAAANYTVSYTGVTLAPGQTAWISVASTNVAGDDPNAAPGTDYTSLGTILEFTGGGVTSKTVAVSTIEDTILEGTEDYAVTIGNQSFGNLASSQVDTDIVDNDASNLNWSIAGSSEITEGGTGNYTVSYTGVTLAPGQTATITVGSTNLPGGDPNATPGTDYTALNTILTFTAGSGTSQTVAVSTIQDTLVEGTEDFAVTIGGQSVGNVATSQADSDIVDNDATDLTWSITGASEVTEGNAAAYTVSYTGASLAPGQTATITVGSANLAGGDPNATPGTDYTALSTILTFTAGTTSQTVAVSTIQDTVLEGTEDFAVTIGGQSAGSLGASQAPTDIIDNDASNLHWSIAGSSQVTEGSAANYTVSYTGVTLAPGQTATITVASTNLAGGDPNATSGTDYTALNTVLTFTAGGGTSQTVAVSTIQDTIVEGTEDFAVTIGGQSVGNVTTSQADTDIIDNDASNLNWSIIGSSQVTEGGAGNYTVSYTGATLAAGQTATITVASANLAGGDPNATSGTDYTALTTVLTFTSGTGTSRTVAVSTIQDTIVEGTEDYAVTIGGQSIGNVATSQADTDIVDNDASNLNWSVTGSTSVTEGNAGTYTVSYTGATLGAGQTATISVATGGGFNSFTDAGSGSDYTALGTVLTFTSGTGTSRTVAVSTIQDTVYEGTEDFTVTIGSQSSGAVVTSQANTVIVDNDVPTWSVTGSSSVTEGNAGNYTVSYTGVTIGAGQTVTISVATGGGFNSFPDATSGTDYTALGTVLTFTSGTGTSRTVAVSTIGDTSVEGTEDFTVTIGNQGAGTIATSQANTVIVDNDAPTWSVTGPTSVTEGGTTSAYTVSYTGVTIGAGQTVTISVATGGGYSSTIPNATSGTDFTALGTVLTFTSGTGTSRTVAVSTIQDTVYEGTEDFTVTIGNQGAGTLATSQANTVIVDNDAPTWSVTGPTSVTEGGTTSAYTVSYTGVTIGAGQTVTISVATGAGYSSTLTDAASGSDYTALGTVLTFTGGGVTSRTVAVSTIQDTVYEGTEDFTVTIGNQGAGTLATSQANTVIVDNDAPTWSVTGSTSVTEGNAGNYTVSYTGVTIGAGQTVTISVATGAGYSSTLTDATSGSDYTALGTVLTFTSGTGTSRTVAVSTINDTVYEGTEDFTVTIGSQGVGTIATSQANTVIVDNDASNLNWSVAGSTSVTEGNAGNYTVSYTGATIGAGQTVTISVATGAGYSSTLTDATSGSDYTALGTVLTFTSGTGTSRTVAVSTINDTVYEGTEDFTVTIGNQGVGSIATSQANTAIVDNDASNLNWSVAGSTSVTEGNAGNYTVSYTGATIGAGQTVTISVATGGGFNSFPTATSGTDFTALGTVLTFTSGTGTSRTVAVSTIQDTVYEGTEDFTVTIGNQGVGSITTSQANTVIVDNDAPAWSVTGPTSVTEGGTTSAYTVSYTGVTIGAGQTVTISVATGGGYSSTIPNATSGTDFTALGTVLTFTGGGVTSRTVAVSTVQDTVYEGTEDFTVTIGNQGAGTLATSQANTVIVDNDAPTWSVTGPTSVTEGGTTSAYTVSYTGVTIGAGQTVTISVATGAGYSSTLTDATSGSDYTALGTVLTFTSGTGTARTVAVSTIQDTIVEGTEDFTVTIGNQGAGTIATSQANTVIVDNDASNLNWSVTGSTSVTEGNTGTYTVSYTGATLAAGQTATISVATGGGYTSTLPNATSGTDFTALSTVLTFTAGTGTSRTVAVSTIQDTVWEFSEDFTVTIGNQSMGSLATSQSNTAIIDNDSPFWSIAGATSVTEGNAGNYTVSYTGVTIGTGQTVTISVATSGGYTSTLTDATSGSDYTALGTVLTFTSGTGTSRTIAVSTINDTAVENTEDFRVTIGGQGAGTIATSQANTIIIDNDTLPVAQPNVSSGNEVVTAQSLNLIVVIDTSGSMGDNPLTNGFSTRMDLAKAAVAQLLEVAEAGGGALNVMIVDFDSGANSSGWTTVDGAIQYLMGIVEGGSTNYNTALNLVMNEINNNPPPAADLTQLYFISDGEPTDGGLDGGGTTTWETFLTTHDIVANAIGVGSGVTATSLDPVGFNGLTAAQLAAILVEDDFSQLASSLVTTLGVNFNGNLFSNDSFGSAGAPANDAVTAVTYNAGGASGFTSAFTVASSHPGDVFTLTGSIGATNYWTLTVNDITGVYDFAVLAPLPHSAAVGTLAFNYSIQDALGNPSSSTLTLNLTDVPTATGSALPFIGDDNDETSLVGTANAEIIGGDDGDDTIVANGGDDYVFGGDGNDSLVGGTGEDVILGGKHADTLSGGDNDDMLFGGKNNDLIVGGAGADYMSGDDGNDTIRSDIPDNEVIDGGDGVDELLLDTTSLNFDLVEDSNVTGIEILNLDASVARTVTLDRQDVLNFNENDLGSLDPDDGSNAAGTWSSRPVSLVVNGTNADTVNLNDDVGGAASWINVLDVVSAAELGVGGAQSYALYAWDTAPGGDTSSVEFYIAIDTDILVNLNT